MNSTDVMAWLNSASISPLNQGHDDTNEEKHLALLHTEGRENGHHRVNVHLHPIRATERLSSHLVK